MATYLEENLNYKVAVDQMNASNPNVQEPFDIINWEMDEVIRNNMEEFRIKIQHIIILLISVTKNWQRM